MLGGHVVRTHLLKLQRYVIIGYGRPSSQLIT
jgi:hypothetical protein